MMDKMGLALFYQLRGVWVVEKNKGTAHSYLERGLGKDALARMTALKEYTLRWDQDSPLPTQI